MKIRLSLFLPALLLACSVKNDEPANSPTHAGSGGVRMDAAAGDGPSGQGAVTAESGASSQHAGSTGIGTGGRSGESFGGSPSAGAGRAPAGSAGALQTQAGVQGGGTPNLGSSGNGGASAGGPPVLGASALPVPPGDDNVARPVGAPGNLQVLDWAGFKAAVSYTFDDTNSSQIDHYAELQAQGVHYTFYLMTDKTAELDDPIWPQAVRDGHEIGNHTRYHEEEDPGGVDTDAATETLERKFGVKIYTMAAPFGSSAYVDIARARFLINRGVSAEPLITPNDDTDPFEISCYIPSEEASAKGEMNGQIDAARASRAWRVVLVHGFLGGDDYAFQPVSITEFLENVKYAKSFGDIWIDSVVNVAAYWRGQKAFMAAKPTQNGDDTVWSWTLPAHFPPGKHLRVRVDGGTLTQGGKPLPWDAHGYYEVSLDTGSLTLSP